MPSKPKTSSLAWAPALTMAMQARLLRMHQCHVEFGAAKSRIPRVPKLTNPASLRNGVLSSVPPQRLTGKREPPPFVPQGERLLRSSYPLQPRRSWRGSRRPRRTNAADVASRCAPAPAGRARMPVSRRQVWHDREDVSVFGGLAEGRP